MTKIEQAKVLLHQNGYYIDNLWSVDDIQQSFYCTEHEAFEVLEDVFNSDYINEAIAGELMRVAEDRELRSRD